MFPSALPFLHLLAHCFGFMSHSSLLGISPSGFRYCGQISHLRARYCVYRVVELLPTNPEIQVELPVWLFLTVFTTALTTSLEATVTGWTDGITWILFLFSSFLIYENLSSSHQLSSSFLPSSPPRRLWCPSVAHMEAGSSHRPGPRPLKHSSGRFHQRPGSVLLMQMFSYTWIENWRDCGPWNIFFHTTTQKHTVCNTGISACNLDRPQSAHLLLRHPPSSLRAVLFLAQAGLYVTGEYV